MDLVLLWAIRLALAALLFMPVLYSSSTVFPFIVGKALYSRAVIEIAFALWLILILRRPEYRSGRSWLTLIFGLFVLGALISGIFGVSFQRSMWSNWERMQGVWDLIHWLLALIVLLSAVKGMRQWRVLFSVNLGIGLLVALLGVYEANGWEWSTFQYLRGNDVTRITSALGNPVYAGAYGMMMALTALALLADSFRVTETPPPPETGRPRRRRRRTPTRTQSGDQLMLVLRSFYALAVVAGIWLILESGSRGAMVGLITGLFAAGVAYGLWGRSQPFRMAATAAAGLLAIAVLSFIALRTTGPFESLRHVSPIFERTVGRPVDEGSTGGDESARIRAVATRIGIEAFLSRPITGWGLENYAVPWNFYLRGEDLNRPGPEHDQAHNKPVEIFATTGIVGGLPYTALWLWLLWLIWRRIRADTESQLFTVFVGGAVVAFWAQLYFLFDTSSSFMLFILIVAYIGTTERGVAAQSSRHLPGDVLAPPGERPVILEVSAGRGPSDLGSLAPRLSTQILISAAILILLGYGLYSLSWRQWDAARNVFSTRIVVENGRNPVLLGNLGGFNPLATLERQWILLGISFEQFPAETRGPVIAVLEKEAAIALAAEPENLQLHLAIAHFYRSAAASVPMFEDDLLAQARTYSEKALELGPQTFGAFEDRVHQAIAERDIRRVREAVHLWRDRPGIATSSANDFDETLEKLEADLAED